MRDKVLGVVRAALQSRLLSGIVFHRSVQAAVRRVPALHRLYVDRISQYGFGARHPFDRAHGTTTSGLVVHADADSAAGTGRFPYAGSQPSIVRAALKVLPSLDSYTFLDLGCGKGRVVIIASEFPFKDVVGVEFSASIAAVGESNLARMRARYPQRAPLRIETHDATTYPMPSGNLVVYLYNPFGEDLIRRIVANLEAALAAQDRRVFVIYYNPIYGHCFDRSPALRRYFAAEMPYAPEELGFGPNESECVVIWQSASPDDMAPLPGAEAAFEVVVPGLRAKMLNTPVR